MLISLFPQWKGWSRERLSGFLVQGQVAGRWQNCLLILCLKLFLPGKKQVFEVCGVAFESRRGAKQSASLIFLRFCVKTLTLIWILTSRSCVAKTFFFLKECKAHLDLPNLIIQAGMQISWEITRVCVCARARAALGFTVICYKDLARNLFRPYADPLVAHSESLPNLEWLILNEYWKVILDKVSHK